MRQLRVLVSTSAAGMVLIKLPQKVVSNYEERAANSVAEVTLETPFSLLVYRLSNSKRLSLKGMVITFVTKHPLALIPIGGEAGADKEKLLHLRMEMEVHAVELGAGKCATTNA